MGELKLHVRNFTQLVTHLIKVISFFYQELKGKALKLNYKGSECGILGVSLVDEIKFFNRFLSHYLVIALFLGLLLYLQNFSPTFAK